MRGAVLSFNLNIEGRYNVRIVKNFFDPFSIIIIIIYLFSMFCN